ncbi:failed axon connections homolog [Artemia franciscana]|uniref:failed axon connections homolog n=1 Tax=Artemia franciscana TaxID=6661 RepID=UPI0032DB5AF2
MNIDFIIRKVNNFAHELGDFVQQNNLAYYGLVGVGLLVTFKAYSSYSYSRKRKVWDSAGKDVVVIHQFNRGKLAPSLSPFPVKLETFCRMARIKYKVDYDDPLGPKGKCPWITFNGKDLADSQFCIEYLRKKFVVDLNKHLTKEERAIAHSFRILVEEHLYWPMAYWRWSLDDTNSLFTVWNSPFIVKLIKPFIGRSVKQAAYAQGIGRHNAQEIYQIAIEDLRALSNFIGSKKFLMGDVPCEEDCAVFGMLVQIVWNLPGSPFEAVMNRELKNLKEYVHRITKELWPDWQEVITSQKTDFTELRL